jgi:NitT/TauT family transport system substrate-binding protein
MQTIKNLLSIVAIICLGLTLSCSTQKPAALTKVVFGISPFQDTLLPIIGEKKGWYKEEGLDVEFKILGWTEVQEALSTKAKNRIDIGINNCSSVVATNNKNPELIYVYGFNTFDNGFALMIRPDNKLKPLKYFLDKGHNRSEAIKLTAQQLKGKKVITTGNTDMEQGVAAAAKKGGLDFLKDIKIIDLAPNEGLAAFLSGEGDAYIGGIPQRTRAGKEGMIEMLSGIDLGPAPINGLVTTKAYYEKNKEVIAKLLKTWFRIVQYVNKDKDAGGKIIIDALNSSSSANFTIDDFKKFWNQYEHYPSNLKEIEENILAVNGRNYWKDRWEDCNNYFYGIKGVIPKPVDPKEAFFMVDMHNLLKQRYGDAINNGF